MALINAIDDVVRCRSDRYRNQECCDGEHQPRIELHFGFRHSSPFLQTHLVAFIVLFALPLVVSAREKLVLVDDYVHLLTQVAENLMLAIDAA
jgi:hypothetical protein